MRPPIREKQAPTYFANPPAMTHSEALWLKAARLKGGGIRPNTRH